MRALLLVAFFVVVAFRLWMIWEVPACTFHSDSHTYLRTARMFWEDGHIGIHPKRALLYPALLTVLHPVPGRLSLHILFVQHALALVVVWLSVRLRRDLAPEANWLDWVLAVLVGLNVPLLFYAHDMMAEIAYAAAFLLYLWRLWRFLLRGGVAHAAGVLWSAALALAVRPDGRMAVLFAVPIIAGVMGAGWWRRGMPQGAWRMVPPIIVCAALWLGGRVTQEGWLFYSSVFPLTDLRSPLHAEYKEELRPWVEAARRDLANYPDMQDDMQGKLGHRKGSIGPRWDALKGRGQDARLHRVCRDLAVEAVLSRPMMFVQLLWYKLRYVLSKERELANEFRPSKMGEDWAEQMSAEPGYIPILWGDGATWERWRDGFFSGQGAGSVEAPLRRLEPITAPPWWGWAGLLALFGWVLGVVRHGWRLALWLAVAAACLVLTFAIARGITRYLVPFEPLWALGVTMLISESCRMVGRVSPGVRARAD
ncbi:MAG TPA: hypothetical protein PLU30_21450 [Verrucomicrobiae bacterium]|nr:hypothetical protein [Verrucomicrobiae bacterium]